MQNGKIDINNIFDDFYTLLNAHMQLSEDKEIQLSIYAIQIDVYGVAKLIDFFNINQDKIWRTNAFVIRVMSIVIFEIIKHFQENSLIDAITIKKSQNYKVIKEFRHKIHQYEYKKFQKHIDRVEQGMGRSRDRLKPMLDTVIEYVCIDKAKHLIGTNIWQYYLIEKEIQADISEMQSFIRSIQERCNYCDDNVNIKKSKNNYKYKSFSYCYTDIQKNSKFISEKVLDRMLLAFDELSSLVMFFKYTIDVDKYLLNSPYIIYFLAKIAASVYDETVDNIEKYIENSNEKDEDRKILIKLHSDISQEITSVSKLMRNNLHYQKQNAINFGCYDELFLFLHALIDECDKIRKNIEGFLDIKPSRIRLGMYQFLRWVQLPTR